MHFIMSFTAQCQRQMLCYRSPHIDGAALGGPAGGSITPSSGILSGDQPPTGASVAAKLTNLLPMANVALSAGSGGIYVGNGLPPVPVKLAAKICRGEFIENGGTPT